MKTDDLRKVYLDFFRSKNHRVFPSDSLVPADDPSLLFTGAGMNQFKPYFLGLKKDMKRAASCQKCLRTADLDRVGKTAYHHSFFEMLGNFSFGDYFKEEAIVWGWEFVTKELKLSPSKLWVSVYQDDDEALNIWKTKVGIPESRIVRMDAVDNFWPSNAQKDGPNGPCGPCSEIYVGEIPGKGVEIWNLVFTQFDRQNDGTLKNLPQKNIDTGMGLERTAAVLQGVNSNFDTDNFQKIRAELKRLLKSGSNETAHENAVMDHIRAVVFSIADGALPSNEGRGYVIRKMIRLASDHLTKAGCVENGMLSKLVSAVVDIYGKAYPEIIDRQKMAMSIIENEEKSYIEVLRNTLPRLEKEINELKQNEDFRKLIKEMGNSSLREEIKLTINRKLANLAFKYYDTYGLPKDVIELCLSSNGFLLNDERVLFENVFKEDFEEQRIRSREHSKITGEIFSKNLVLELIHGISATDFLGYEKLSSDAKLLCIIENNSKYMHLATGREALLIFDKSPFYAESGGQVGDIGIITGNGAKAVVLDSQYIEKCIAHRVRLDEGVLDWGLIYNLAVDVDRRADIMKNHTATHLLHVALRKVLGEHVKQSGSLVAPDRLRFDFTHFSALDAKAMAAVEELVNAEIRKNITLDKKVMSKEKAVEAGAIAFFGEKYGDEVRVVSVGDFSKELCGGTHLHSTGEIGLFKIISESSIQAGVRRIEAVTGRGAKQFLEQNEQELETIANEFKVRDKANILEEIKKIRTRVENLKDKALSLASNKWIKLEKAKEIGGIRFWDSTLVGADKNLIQKGLSILDSQHSSYAGIIYSTFFNQPNYYVVGSGDLVQKGFDCNLIIKNVNQEVDGRGGGKPNFASGGLKESPTPDKINHIISTGTANIISFIEKK